MRPSDFISRVCLCLIKIILNVVVVFLKGNYLPQESCIQPNGIRPGNTNWNHFIINYSFFIWHKPDLR